jgi:HlyD family secretion protein
MKSKIFRQVSLERLSSPEQLDQLMQVTDRRGWLLLLVIGVVLSTAITWSIFGSLPETVNGTGILVKSGGVFEVVPTAPGRVVDIAVTVGDTVSEGQVVARVAQPELRDRVLKARTALAARRQELERLVAFGSADATLQRAAIDAERTTLRATLASQERTIRWLEEKVRNQQQLVEEGLVTRTALTNTQQQLDQARERRQQAQAELARAEVRQLDLRNRRGAEQQALEIAVAEQTQALNDLERELRVKGEIVAPYRGRILEVLAERGSVIGAGEPVVTLDLSGRMVKGLEAVLYVPSKQGKQVRPGMRIQIAPSTVKPEEHGFMVGRVTYVSDFPASSRAMRRTLKNDKLVTQLSGEDAPYELHADLEVDPETYSRYRWTSADGPPMRIQSGTMAAAAVTVRSRRPIEMVLPLLRKYSGV